MSRSDPTPTAARASTPDLIPLVLTSRAPAQTSALAQVVAAHLQSGDVVLLIGDLGTGKTTFTQAMVAALGVSDPVTSPTFTIMRHYPTTAGWTLLHLDAYRLRGPADLFDLGLDELLDENAVAVIEWGDIVAAAVGPDHLDLHFTWGDDDAREIRAVAHGRRWAECIGIAGPT